MKFAIADEPYGLELTQVWPAAVKMLLILAGCTNPDVFKNGVALLRSELVEHLDALDQQPIKPWRFLDDGSEIFPPPIRHLIVEPICQRCDRRRAPFKRFAPMLG
jgi:hypothetical protein